jgi:hypothetical protein
MRCKISKGAVISYSQLVLFVTFLSSLNFVVAQESPGGVSTNLALWLKDDGVTDSGNTLTGWQDQTRANSFNVSGNPITNTSNLNLNNTISFYGAGDFLTGTTAIDFKNGYAVYKLYNTANSTLLSATVAFNGNTGYFFKGPNHITGDNAADGEVTFLTTDGDIHSTLSNLPTKTI